MVWNDLSSMQYPRDAFAAISHGNRIYVFGGSTLSTAEVYDIGTKLKQLDLHVSCVDFT